MSLYDRDLVRDAHYWVYNGVYQDNEMFSSIVRDDNFYEAVEYRMQRDVAFVRALEALIRWAHV